MAMSDDKSANLQTHGSVPVPDPTLLTTQQLIREIEALRNHVDIRLDGLKQLSDVRHDALATQFRERDTRMDQTARDNAKAIDAALQAAKEAAAAIDEKTAHLAALHDEKFRSIAIQFVERDTRAEQTSRDSKVAVDAALQAAKEAVGEQNRSNSLSIAKSETATAKSIDQLQTILQTATSAIDSKIADLKERLTIIEGKSLGMTTQHITTQGSQIQWVGIIGLVLGVVVAVISVVVSVSARP